jgi:hypothetical protein
MRLPGTSLDPHGPVAFWRWSSGGQASASAAELAPLTHPKSTWWAPGQARRPPISPCCRRSSTAICWQERSAMCSTGWSPPRATRRPAENTHRPRCTDGVTVTAHLPATNRGRLRLPAPAVLVQHRPGGNHEFPANRRNSGQTTAGHPQTPSTGSHFNPTATTHSFHGTEPTSSRWTGAPAAPTSKSEPTSNPHSSTRRRSTALHRRRRTRHEMDHRQIQQPAHTPNCAQI